MAIESKLQAEIRSGTGKGVARKLRADGKLPAVLYGGDAEPAHITLDAHDAEYLFRNISVDNTIVALHVDGEKEAVQTLVREIQVHPWKATLLHVDFLRIQKGVMIDVNVPLNLVGTPIGVQRDGGVIEQIIHDLPIKCIPSNIPETIEVDISHLELHEVLHVSDLTMGEGVEITVAPERTVCSVSLPKAAEEAAADEDDEDEGADGAAGTPGTASADDSEGEG